MLHPPPMRNEISLPTIRKQGEMRVPWGRSAPSGFCRPAVSLSGSILHPPYPPVPLLLGAFSVAYCWIVTKCRLVNESCACHFPSTNSIFKVKAASWWERKRGNFYPSEYSTTIIRYHKFPFTVLYLPLLQCAPVNPEGHLQRNPLSVYPAWHVPLFEHGLLLQGFCLKTKWIIPYFVIILGLSRFLKSQIIPIPSICLPIIAPDRKPL